MTTVKVEHEGKGMDLSPGGGEQKPLDFGGNEVPVSHPHPQSLRLEAPSRAGTAVGF